MWASHFHDDVVLGVADHYFRESGVELRRPKLAVSE
jgi:hypothetical protein